MTTPTPATTPAQPVPVRPLTPEELPHVAGGPITNPTV